MRSLTKKLLLLILLSGYITAFAQNGQSKLFETMQALDTQLFDAANHCDYEKLTAMVDESLEFYHDQGGLTLGKQLFLDSIKNNTCGMMIRELVPGTLQVYPIKGYGAVEMGYHRFHSINDTGPDSHYARFVHIWHRENGQWKITRVISLHG